MGKRLGALALGILFMTGLSATEYIQISPARQAELRNLLAQDCGSCHGLRLRGGLGPPLRGAALAGKPASYLAATILFGRPGTAMPPWQPFLTEEEAVWLANLLLEQP